MFEVASGARIALLATLGLSLVGGCDQAPPSAASRAVPKIAVPKTAAPKAAAPKAAAPKAAAPKTEAPKVEAPKAETPQASEPAQDLGARFRDPAWFNKTMLGDATAVNTARTEADSSGLFKSHIVFEFPEGTTLEMCADLVTKQVKSAVPGLTRTVQSDGRIKVSGATQRYSVTLLCGETEGKTRAYVGYAWTS